MDPGGRRARAGDGSRERARALPRPAPVLWQPFFGRRASPSRDSGGGGSEN